MILTICILYIIAVVIYTISVRLSGTNKYVPKFEWKSTILDGMKGMGIGFLILAILYFGLTFINNFIY